MQTTNGLVFEMNLLKNGQEKPITSAMIIQALAKLANYKKPSLSKVA